MILMTPKTGTSFSFLNFLIFFCFKSYIFLPSALWSALACLPDGLREKLIDSEEERNKYQKLHESVNSISTGDALKLFHDEENKKKSVDTGASSNGGCLQEQSSDNRSLENYIGELQSLVSESPAIRVQFAADKHFQP